MYNIRDILDQIEDDERPHRWSGCGAGAGAVLCGFKRPAGDDDSGIWRHPVAGDFHDSLIPSVVRMVLTSYLKTLRSEDPMNAVAIVRDQLKVHYNSLVNCDTTSECPEFQDGFVAFVAAIEKAIGCAEDITL